MKKILEIVIPVTAVVLVALTIIGIPMMIGAHMANRPDDGDRSKYAAARIVLKQQMKELENIPTRKVEKMIEKSKDSPIEKGGLYLRFTEKVETITDSGRSSKIYIWVYEEPETENFLGRTSYWTWFEPRTK